MCGLSCSSIISKWRLWIRPVVMTVYALIIVVILPILIVNAVNNGFQKRDQSSLIGGVFVMMALPISFWGITQHMVHYTKPSLQKHIIRILWMVPIYALNADISASAYASIRLSYQIALLIARSLRSFTDGEFVKQCLVLAAQEFCPLQINQFEGVSLSARTMSRRIQDLGDDLYEQLLSKCKTFIAFSVAIDESTDISSTAQLAIFIRGVNEDLEVTEELMDIVPMQDTTTGQDILNCVEESVENAGLEWESLVSVATDGAPAMIGSKSGFVALLKQKLGRDIAAVHCLIHQENLCAKQIRLNNVMGTVVKIVNILRSHGLKHRQFKNFLESLHCEYGDIPYHTEVRWLSRGKVLDRFFHLLNEIILFMDMNTYQFTELSNYQWKCDLAFMADISEHFNNLNLTLQGKDMMITHMWESVQGFKDKLELWSRQLSSGNAVHFPRLTTLREESSSTNYGEYVEVLQSITTEFERRFQDVTGLQSEFDIFSKPFAVNIDNAPSEIQLELIDLKRDSELKDRYTNRKSLKEFYSRFPRSKFPFLHRRAAIVMSMFGSTYVCEKMFSAMKICKSSYRSSLSDRNLKCSLRIHSSTSLSPNIGNIISKKKRNKKSQSSEVQNALCVN